MHNLDIIRLHENVDVIAMLNVVQMNQSNPSSLQGR